MSVIMRIEHLVPNGTRTSLFISLQTGHYTEIFTVSNIQDTSV